MKLLCEFINPGCVKQVDYVINYDNKEHRRMFADDAFHWLSLLEGNSAITTRIVDSDYEKFVEK